MRLPQSGSVIHEGDKAWTRQGYSEGDSRQFKIAKEPARTTPDERTVAQQTRCRTGFSKRVLVSAFDPLRTLSSPVCSADVWQKRWAAVWLRRHGRGGPGLCRLSGVRR